MALWANKAQSQNLITKNFFSPKFPPWGPKIYRFADSKKVNLGSATFLTLGQIASDEQTLKSFQAKENARFNNIAKQAMKIAEVEESKNNRGEAVEVLKKNGCRS